MAGSSALHDARGARSARTHDRRVYAQVLAAAQPQRQDLRRAAWRISEVPLAVRHQFLKLRQHLGEQSWKKRGSV